MRYVCVALLFMLTGCSVLEGLISEPSLVAPVVEKAVLAVSSPSVVSITDVVVALAAAVTGALGYKCVNAKKLKT